MTVTWQLDAAYLAHSEATEARAEAEAAEIVASDALEVTARCNSHVTAM